MATARRAACVIGYPARHSRSPKLHGYWLRRYGIDGDYRAALAAIGQLLESLRQRPELSAAVLRQSPLPAPGAAAQVLRSDGASARFTLELELRASDDAAAR